MNQEEIPSVKGVPALSIVDAHRRKNSHRTRFDNRLRSPPQIESKMPSVQIQHTAGMSQPHSAPFTSPGSVCILITTPCTFEFAEKTNEKKWEQPRGFLLMFV